MKRVAAFLAAMVVCLATPALAAPTPQTKLNLEIGWGNVYRTGRWVPVYVTLSDPKTRQAIIEVEQPHAGQYVMQLRQPVVIGPVPQPNILYLPLAHYGWDAMPRISVRDVNGELLAEWSAQAQQEDDSARLPRQVTSNARLIGVTGRTDNLTEYANALGGNGIEMVSVSQRLLPDATVGYDMLDLLILNRADLTRIDDAQQQAIVDWVRAGGVLLVVPGDEGTPASSPIGAVLPAKVGEPKQFSVPPIPTMMKQPAQMMSFSLTPAASAAELPFPFAAENRGGLKAYTQRVGFGRIIVMPLDLVRAPFNSNNHRESAFKDLLKHTGILTNLADPQVVDNNWRECSELVQDHLANIPGAGRFGFGYVGWGLLAMMLVVGPIDWFVLKLMRRQPWTWITLTGWIGLLTGGAIMVGQVFKSGDLHYRSVQLVDQADDKVVGRTTVLSIYSPRTTQYELTPPNPTMPGEPLAGWWQPAVAGFRRGGPLKIDVGFDRSATGVSPRPLNVAVWNVRFLQGQTYEKSDPWIAADLSIQREGDKPALVGTIQNLSPYPLTDIRIDTASGFASPTAVIATPAVAPPSAADKPAWEDDAPRISQRQSRRQAAPVAVASLAPRQSIQIRLTLADPPSSPESDSNSNSYRNRYYGNSPPPEPAKAWALTPDLSPIRSWREVYERENNSVVTIYAQANSATPSASLANPEAKTRHETLLRALMTVKGGK